MQTAKSIAEKVQDKYKYERQYPVGKAQQTILSALGITAHGASHADQIFEALGITVSAKRVGRKSVPVVKRAGGGSAKTPYGDYDVWDSPSENIDLTAIQKWME